MHLIVGSQCSNKLRALVGLRGVLNTLGWSGIGILREIKDYKFRQTRRRLGVLLEEPFERVVRREARRIAARQPAIPESADSPALQGTCNRLEP